MVLAQWVLTGITSNSQVSQVTHKQPRRHAHGRIERGERGGVSEQALVLPSGADQVSCALSGSPVTRLLRGKRLVPGSLWVTLGYSGLLWVNLSLGG